MPKKKSLCTVDLETSKVLMFRIGLVSYATVVSMQNRLLECLNYFLEIQSYSWLLRKYDKYI